LISGPQEINAYHEINDCDHDPSGHAAMIFFAVSSCIFPLLWPESTLENAHRIADRRNVCVHARFILFFIVFLFFSAALISHSFLIACCI
jgi:hypothetical protein